MGHFAVLSLLMPFKNIKTSQKHTANLIPLFFLCAIKRSEKKVMLWINLRFQKLLSNTLSSSLFSIRTPCVSIRVKANDKHKSLVVRGRDERGALHGKWFCPPCGTSRHTHSYRTGFGLLYHVLMKSKCRSQIQGEIWSRDECRHL